MGDFIVCKSGLASMELLLRLKIYIDFFGPSDFLFDELFKVLSSICAPLFDLLHLACFGSLSMLHSVGAFVFPSGIRMCGKAECFLSIHWLGNICIVFTFLAIFANAAKQCRGMFVYKFSFGPRVLKSSLFGKY